jgi:hypothetical protein
LSYKSTLAYFVDLLNNPKVINPEPNKIDTATKGNPEPTKSSILADQRNGKQKSIPNTPANMLATAMTLIAIFKF